MRRIQCQVGVAIEQVNQFKQAWMSYSYKFTKEYTSIYASQLVEFLNALPPPLGVGAEGSYYDCQILAKKVIRLQPALFIGHATCRVLMLRVPWDDRPGKNNGHVGII